MIMIMRMIMMWNDDTDDDDHPDVHDDPECRHTDRQVDIPTNR